MERLQKNLITVTRRDARIFVFGDSLSDIGNIFEATNNIYPPSPPYFEGRLSNGPVAVETLATGLGLTATPETNFAIGGAKTGRDNIGDIGPLKFGGLLDQVDEFASTVGSQGAPPNALYFVWIGGDDLLSQPIAPILAVNQAVENVKTAVTTLADLGAQNIIVVQNPNLGRTPFSLQAGLLESFTAVTQAFNARLRSTLRPLERSLNLNVILPDLFTVSERIAQDPSRFGFSNVVDPYLQGLLPGDPSANPNRFFFWDDVHPTSRGHLVFAEAFRQIIIDKITDGIRRLGTLLNDVLIGYSGDDLLDGRAGRDRIEGNGGNDTLLGGQGRDLVKGQQDNDLILGGFGRDILQGGAGRDRIFGQVGRDSLSGGTGIDFLSGGLNDDLLNGGGGCDVFSLRLQNGTDTVQDFDTDNDLLLLAGRLRFDQLTIRQQGQNTVIEIASTNRAIAILENVQAGSIDSTDFLGGNRNELLIELANRRLGGVILDAIQAELSGLRTLFNSTP